MSDLTHLDLEHHLHKLEQKIDDIHEMLIQVKIDLEVHKAKTSWTAVVGSAFVSLLIGLGAVLLR